MGYRDEENKIKIFSYVWGEREEESPDILKWQQWWAEVRITVYIFIFRFLSQTCPASSLTDLAELVLDMASVIVERSSLLPAILPGQIRVKFKQKVFGRFSLFLRRDQWQNAGSG